MQSDKKNIFKKEKNGSKNPATVFLEWSGNSDLVFWMIYLLLAILSSQRIDHTQGEVGVFLIRKALDTVIIMIALAINNRVLVPAYLKKSKGSLYTIFLVFMILILSFISYQIILMISHSNELILAPFEKNREIGAFLFNAVPMLFFVALNLFLHVFKEWVALQDIEIRLQEAKKEALKVQLENLKAQVNPHFLFNTLNNIYSLSLFKDDRTPEVILKLSDLLSYMIYDCRADKVSMDREREFIENYTALEKLRFNDKALLELELDKNWNMLEIAPLLFAPFLENAFKHGMNIHSRDPKIHIELKNLNDGRLRFFCENYTDNIAQEGPGGIGLVNVRSRLRLLYPQRHTLTVKNDGKKFTVDLIINIENPPELSQYSERSAHENN